MKQVIKKDKLNKVSEKPKTKVIKPKQKKKHPQYGTSKLEEDFAKEFLEKLKVPYQYQFEAKDIGRFYDFYLPQSNLIIEIDGDYWHGNPDKYEKDELKKHQIRAQRVDEYKNKWALLHGIPILRIWESDIRKNPKKVMKILKEELNIQEKNKLIQENKRKRH
jgi:very-short-patch-repair endonuclease